jgi:MFS family permease
LLAGVVGGFLGPDIATRCKDLLPYGEYSGSYAALAIIYILVLVVMSLLPSMRAQDERYAGADSPLIRVISRPRFLVAVFAGSVAYGVMSLIMTATPISMHTLHGHSLQATALVIQSHVIAMFLPSLITGSLITRAGVPQVMGLGILAMFACIALDVAGTQIFNYWTALTLLGVGWNFLFVGSTVMLTESYLPAERFKAQGFNDFVVFGIQALASLSAGALVFRSSWATINLLAVPLLLGVLIAIVLVSRRTQPIKMDEAALGSAGSQD